VAQLKLSQELNKHKGYLKKDITLISIGDVMLLVRLCDLPAARVFKGFCNDYLKYLRVVY
jgi:hypothetical protein